MGLEHLAAIKSKEVLKQTQAHIDGNVSRKQRDQQKDLPVSKEKFEQQSQ